MMINSTFTLLFFLVLDVLFSHSLFSAQHVKVAVMGSGPAGLTAGLYTSRAGLSTMILEGNEPGGQITLSYMVDNFPGFPDGINGFDLIQNMRQQAERFGAKIDQNTVVSVNLSERPFALHLEGGDVLLADALIIATGASAKWLGLDSEQKFIGNGVSSCAVCDGPMYRNKEVVVVGGGNTALEDALFLSNYASKVTIVHRRESFRASKHIQDKVFANSKIHVLWNHEVVDILDAHEKVLTGVKVQSTENQKSHVIPCEGVFVAIGHNPNTELFQGQLDFTADGYIKIQLPSTQTSKPGVFAAGDVTDSHYRQAITASGSGCMAGIDAYQFLQQ